MSLQIVTRKRASVVNRVAIAETKIQPDPYQDRLLKLIPAEIVAVYLAVNQGVREMDLWIHWAAFAIMFLLNIAYKRKAGVKDLLQLALSGIAFVLWVMVIGGPFDKLSPSYQQIAPILVPIYTLFVPLVYK